MGNFSEGLLCLSTSGNYRQVEILTGNFSTVPGKNFDLCIISTRINIVVLEIAFLKKLSQILNLAHTFERSPRNKIIFFSVE